MQKEWVMMFACQEKMLRKCTKEVYQVCVSPPVGQPAPVLLQYCGYGYACCEEYST